MSEIETRLLDRLASNLLSFSHFQLISYVTYITTFRTERRLPTG